MTGSKLILQERDERILRALRFLVVVDREQAKALGPFASTARANARLLELTRAGYLRRAFIPAGRFGQKAVYALPRRERRGVILAARMIPHQLALNDVYLALSKPSVAPEAPRLVFWSAPRSTTNSGFIPDAYAEIKTPAGRVSVFVEVDRGTESLSVWKSKAERYLEFALSGEFQRLYKRDYFRVAVIAPSETRAASISRTISAVTAKLFWITASPHIVSNGISSPVWVRPGRDERVPLA